MESILDIDFAAWAVVIGAALPIVISFLKNSSWSEQVKKYVAAAISVVVAVVYTGAAEGWAVDSFSDFWSLAIVSAGAIFTLAQATYKGFWENTKVETFARKSLVGTRDKSNELEV
jgi:hypothetical protein